MNKTPLRTIAALAALASFGWNVPAFANGLKQPERDPEPYLLLGEFREALNNVRDDAETDGLVIVLNHIVQTAKAAAIGDDKTKFVQVKIVDDILGEMLDTMTTVADVQALGDLRFFIRDQATHYRREVLDEEPKALVARFSGPSSLLHDFNYPPFHIAHIRLRTGLAD